MEEKKKSRFKVEHKGLRIGLRVLGILIGLYLLVLIGLSIYITSSKERLISYIRDKLKQTVIGELKINNADITIWQSFPKVGLTLQNVSISDSFYHRPILKADQITTKIGLFDLLGKKVTVSTVIIKNALFHSFTDANGYTNTYIFKPKNTPGTESKSKDKKPFVINNIQLKNVTAIIQDVPKHKQYIARINTGDVDMSLSNGRYHIDFDEDIFMRGLGFNLKQGYWMENRRIQAEWNLEFDTAEHNLIINESTVKIQGQPYKISGEFNFGKSEFHLTAATKGTSFDSALLILKPKTRATLHKVGLSAPVDASVSLKGSLSKKGDPAVKADFKTENSNLSTPILNLNSCSFSANYTNQYNPNTLPDDSNSRIQATYFVSKWGDVDLKAKGIAITNLVKPVLQFEFFSECTLPQLNDALSSDVLQFTEGAAKLYLSYNGPLIADVSLLNRLNAKIQIVNGKIVYVSRNLTFSKCNGAIDLEGNNLNVNNLQCDLNTNHFVINIVGSNLNRFSNDVSGKANLNCNVFTPALDLSDFKTLFNAKTKTTKKRNAGLGGLSNSLDDAFENGNAYVNLKANQLSLHNFQASNVTAILLFTSSDWEVQKAYLQFADGSFNLAAKVHEVSDAIHQATVQMDLSHINVKKLFYAFDNFGMASLTSKNLTGAMESKANIVANIDNTGKFVPSSMNGKMYFSLKNASLVNFQPFIDIQKSVFKNRDLNNVQFAELKDTLDIQNGDINIHRMPIQSSAITMYVEGIYSFTDKTDISIQVPISTLRNKPDEDFKQIDKDKANKPGASIYLRAKDKDGQVKIGLDVFKKFRKDKNKDDDNN